MRKYIALLLIVVALATAACVSCGAPVQQDGDYTYEFIPFFGVDTGYYELQGVVEPQSVVVPMAGVVEMPYLDLGKDNESFSDVVMYRIRLTHDVEWVGQSADSVWASRDGSVYGVAGQTFYPKMHGAPVHGAEIGDEIRIRCRRQFETVGAIAVAEDFDKDDAIVWEWENCRLVNGGTVAPAPVADVEQ